MSQIMGRVPNYRTSRIILGALESLCRFGGFRFRQPWLLGSGSDLFGIERFRVCKPGNRRKRDTDTQFRHVL